MRVLYKRKELPDKVYINDDYSALTTQRINMLRPVFKLAKKTDPSAKLIKDKLIYKKKAYTAANIMSIDLNVD